jgi:DNA-binding Lrp family transcriptional regulator
MAAMDQIDAALVRELQRDGRQTNRELARRVGIAPSTCLERVRTLRRRGVITGFHATVDLAALDRRLEALIAVQARPLSREVIDGFKRHVSAMPEVLAVFVLTGADDFLVHVAVRDMDHLHAFLLDRFTRRKEIVSFRTSVIYQHLRNTIVEPLGGAPPP